MFIVAVFQRVPCEYLLSLCGLPFQSVKGIFLDEEKFLFEVVQFVNIFFCTVSVPSALNLFLY